MNRRNEGDVVLLVVEPPSAEEAIALRDPRQQAVLSISLTPEDHTSLLTAMGAWDGDFHIGDSRYGNVCVVAPTRRQAQLVAFVAATVWPIVEAGLLHVCEPPYDVARARPVSTADAQAALDASNPQGS